MNGALLEQKFEKRFGSTQKVNACGKQIELALACQIIGVLVVLDAFMKFGSTGARWGAPCFHWESYPATIVTFVGGHLVRLIGLPIGIWVVLTLRKGGDTDKPTGILFQFLCALAAVLVLDLAVCLFEVHDVCGSEELVKFNQCAHTWGAQAHVCTADLATDQSVCHAVDATLARDKTEDDKAKCEKTQGCAYGEKPVADRVIPACCTDAIWSGKFSPCGPDGDGTRAPAERSAVFDSTWCEEVSDLYVSHRQPPTAT